MTVVEPRIDSASRVIKASRRAIYSSFLSGEALIAWRRPTTMTGKVYAFDPRVGGGYRMSLTYGESDHSQPGKTAEHEDVFSGRFVEMTADERVVEMINFETDDRAFAGSMKMTTSLVDVAEGTKVTIACEDVPDGIGREDHLVGLRMALENLAKFTE